MSREVKVVRLRDGTTLVGIVAEGKGIPSLPGCLVLWDPLRVHEFVGPAGGYGVSLDHYGGYRQDDFVSIREDQVVGVDSVIQEFADYYQLTAEYLDKTHNPAQVCGFLAKTVRESILVHEGKMDVRDTTIGKMISGAKATQGPVTDGENESSAVVESLPKQGKKRLPKLRYGDIAKGTDTKQ